MADADRSKVEHIKEGSGYLRGSLADELAADSPAFAKASTSVLKFHGIYQQDDRDTRRERGRQGLGKDYVCMVRVAVPGGALSREQYFALDRVADEVADGTIRVTTRQSVQLHFTRKHDLPGLIGALNRELLTTLAACGDVVRNVMCCPAPLADRPANAELQRLAAWLSRELKPRSDAYWQLWMDGERVASAAPPPAGGDDDDTEPLYGPTYLPRKFKIGFAAPGDNCIDTHTHDIGVAPHVEDGRVVDLTLTVGGGLGMTHNNAATYPRLGEPLGRVTPERLLAAVTAIVGIQRDHGERGDRKYARMKYLIDAWGLDAFRAEVERRLGAPLDAPRELDWGATHDHLGWHRQADGRWFVGVRVPSGRIADTESARLRTALRAIVADHADGVRLTPRQDVLLTGIAESDRPAVEALLAWHGVAGVDELTPTARHALACPALPTCGLAISEAERVLDDIVAGVDAELAALGLDGDAVQLRVTGCPNGCARPYSTEVGVVGRGADKYTLFVGGAAEGDRLNTTYADHVASADVGATLRPALRAWRDEGAPGEAFGDFCHRLGVDALAERGGAERQAVGA